MNDNELSRLIKEWRVYLGEINPYHKSDGTWGSKKNSKVYSLTQNAMDDIAKDSEVEVPARGKVTKKGKISSKFGMNGPDPEKACGRLKMDGSKKKKTRSCKDYPKSYDEGLLVAPAGTLKVDASHSAPQGVKRPRKAIRVKIYKRKARLDDEQGREVSKKRKRDKILPGYGDLQSLSRGIMEQLDGEISLEELIQGLRYAMDKSPENRVEIERQMGQAGFYSRSMMTKACRQQGKVSLQDWMKIQDQLALAQKGELFKQDKPK